MKRYIIFILFSLSLFAQEPALATLISQIREAKVEDRRVLMNQLKVKLREMNKESRQRTMRELKHSFSKESCKTGQMGQRKHQHKAHPSFYATWKWH